MGGCYSKLGNGSSRTKDQLIYTQKTITTTAPKCKTINIVSKTPENSMLGRSESAKSLIVRHNNQSKCGTPDCTPVIKSKFTTDHIAPNFNTKVSTPRLSLKSTTLEYDPETAKESLQNNSNCIIETESNSKTSVLPLAQSNKSSNANRIEGKWRARPSNKREGPYHATDVPLVRENINPIMRLHGSVTDGALNKLSDSLREVEALQQPETYRAFKQSRQKYISKPRACSDNFQMLNYSRCNSAATSSSDAEESLNNSFSKYDRNREKICSNPSIAYSNEDNNETKKSDTMESSSPFFSANILSQRLHKDGLFRKKKYQPITVQSTPVAVINSASSLSSDDLMLTTEIGLDEPDDDIIKDIDDTEKEDPFLVEADNIALPHIPSIMSASYPSPLQTHNFLTDQLCDGDLRKFRSVSSPLRPPISQLRRERTLSDSQDLKLECLLEEDQVFFSAADIRCVTQDVTSLKTLLLRLKRLLLEDEDPSLNTLNSPINKSNNSLLFRRSGIFSEPSTPMAPPLSDGFLEDATFTLLVAANQDLSEARPSLEQLAENSTCEALIKEVALTRQEVSFLRHQLQERDNSIRLLQQQMTKYTCPTSSTKMKSKFHPRPLSVIEYGAADHSAMLVTTIPQSIGTISGQ